MLAAAEDGMADWTKHLAEMRRSKKGKIHNPQKKWLEDLAGGAAAHQRLRQSRQPVLCPQMLNTVVDNQLSELAEVRP